MREKIYKIGEAAELLGVRTSVLRFWEDTFSQLRPHRTDKGQRYYSEKDIALLRRIQNLLYEEGMTISGAKRALKQKPILLIPASPEKILSLEKEKGANPGASHGDNPDASHGDNLGINTGASPIVAKISSAIAHTLAGVMTTDSISSNNPFAEKMHSPAVYSCRSALHREENAQESLKKEALEQACPALSPLSQKTAPLSYAENENPAASPLPSMPSQQANRASQNSANEDSMSQDSINQNSVSHECQTDRNPVSLPFSSQPILQPISQSISSRAAVSPLLEEIRDDLIRLRSWINTEDFQKKTEKEKGIVDKNADSAQTFSAVCSESSCTGSSC